ncbi:MAG: hypothetical protein ACKOW9_04110, partial [Candidatus Paceibacterota bacterium]
MAKEKPGEKKFKTVDERLLSGKKALLESYRKNLENPKTSAEKIEVLRQEADKLIQEIQYLEEKTVAGLKQTNPIDAGKIERELTPIVNEALEIQRQLAELDAREATLDTEEAEIDARIRTLKSSSETEINAVETEEVEEGEKPKMDQESWLTEEVNNFIAEFGL